MPISQTAIIEFMQTVDPTFKGRFREPTDGALYGALVPLIWTGYRGRRESASVETAPIYPKGITVRGLRYFSPAPEFQALVERAGQVILMYDLDDLATLYVWHGGQMSWLALACTDQVYASGLSMQSHVSLMAQARRKAKLKRQVTRLPGKVPANDWPSFGLPSMVKSDNGREFTSAQAMEEVEMDSTLYDLLSVDRDGNPVAPPVMLVRRK